jgi:hypothetical protein
MKTTLIHTLHDALELRYEDQPLFTYVYESKTPTLESPKPYFHPLKTLAGNEVSLFRPHDHLWHIGLSMSIANLSEENFWGGPTYTRESGYVQLNNNGRIQHIDWQEISCNEEVHCVEHLKWITQTGETWFDEERHIAISEINPEAGYWSLDLSFALVNVSQQPLAFGSPTTEGRPNAGYGGLFWRGPRSFLHGRILGADGLEGPESMGQQLPAGMMEIAINQPSCSLISQGIRVIRTSGLYAMIRMPASVAHLCLMSTIPCNRMKR